MNSLSLSPPAAARSLGAIEAPRTQMKCQGIAMHDALNSYLLCLVVMNLLHVNIS